MLVPYKCKIITPSQGYTQDPTSLFQVDRLPAISSPYSRYLRLHNGPERKGLLQELQSRPAPMSFRILILVLAFSLTNQDPNLCFSFYTSFLSSSSSQQFSFPLFIWESLVVDSMSPETIQSADSCLLLPGPIHF